MQNPEQNFSVYIKIMLINSTYQFCLIILFQFRLIRRGVGFGI